VQARISWTTRKAARTLRAQNRACEPAVIAFELARIQEAQLAVDNCTIRAAVCGNHRFQDAQVVEMVSPISAGGRLYADRVGTTIVI